MALEGDQVGLENLSVDQSDTTVTFPNCPYVASEIFQPKRTSTKKPDKSTWVCRYVMLKDARSQFKLSFHFSQVVWYNSLTDTVD